MVADLVGMVVESPKTFAAKFGEEYSNSDIGADKPGDSSQMAGKGE